MDAIAGSDPKAGIQLYLSQDYAGAERLLGEAVKAQPAWAEGLSYLGFSQYMQQKYSEAGTNLERAVLLDQDNAEARFGLGLVWAAMKRVDAAIACWDETLRLNPSHADAKRSLVGGLIHRAQASIATKDYDRAEADLERVIKIDRSSSAAVVVLANHFIQQGMTARAERTVREALGYLPNDPQVLALAQQLNVKASKDAQVAAQDAQAKQQIQKSQEVPCPNCKRPVMEWAAICPHCNMQIKALPSVFAGRQAAVSAVEWQDIAFYICTSLWIILSALPLLIQVLAGHAQQAFSGFGAFSTTISLGQVGVGIGCLFKQDTMLFIAKILCYIVLLFGSINFMLMFFGGVYVVAAIEACILGITGFMVYLLNYMSG